MTGAKSITAYDIHHIESFHDIPMISGREIMNAYSQVKGEYGRKKITPESSTSFH